MDGSVADSLLSSYDGERIFSFRAAALPVDDAETYDTIRYEMLF